MITFTHVSTDDQIIGIKALQSANLPNALSKEEMRDQGFVTCDHTKEVLVQMNTPYPHTIAIKHGKVIAYALSMTQSAKSLVPILGPMFEKMDKLTYREATLSDFTYIVMGQICIDKAYRGQHVFYKLYDNMKQRLAPYFELCITEVSCHNTRSLRAHEKQGFDVVEEYIAPNGHPWKLLVWNWRKDTKG